MIHTSDAFAALIDIAPEQLHLVLSDDTEIPQSAIKKASWSRGSNAGDDITLGSTVAARLQVELDMASMGGVELADARITASLTITGADDVLPVAVLQVSDLDSDDDIITAEASDAMIYAFSVAYALDDAALGFDFSTGVDGETLLQAICNACGVPLGTTGLPPVTLTNVDASGYTYREVIAFLACLWGRFARINSRGELVLQWYTAADRLIPPTRYYQGELKKADYAYTVSYIKCYCEPLEETMTAGDTSKAQGIYIECPWMTPERLRVIYQEIGGFAYRPVSGLRFLGDPRLEPGDVLQVTDRDGTTYTVPVMTLQQEYDGGLITQISAAGKSISASKNDYDGPVTREIKKAVRGIKTSLVKLEDRIVSRVEDTEGHVTQIQQTVDGITLEVTEVTDENGDVKAQITLKIGENSYSGLIAMVGNVQLTGQMVADAIYSVMGEFANLKVDRLSTSRRIVRYLAGDKSDDNYVRIQEERVEFVTGTTDGSSEQAKSPSGDLLYWEADTSACTLGDDGYPYLESGERVFMTTKETAWPVKVYVYAEQVKRCIAFAQIGDTYIPTDIIGAGDQTGYNRGMIYKDTDDMTIAFIPTGGQAIGIKMGNDGFVDIVGLRKPLRLDFSNFENGSFIENLDGIVDDIVYNVTFDDQERPIRITDEAGHETEIVW